jgi:hypothetical protein
VPHGALRSVLRVRQSPTAAAPRLQRQGPVSETVPEPAGLVTAEVRSPAWSGDAASAGLILSTFTRAAPDGGIPGGEQARAMFAIAEKRASHTSSMTSRHVRSGSFFAILTAASSSFTKDGGRLSGRRKAQWRN